MNTEGALPIRAIPSQILFFHAGKTTYTTCTNQFILFIFKTMHLWKKAILPFPFCRTIRYGRSVRPEHERPRYGGR